MALQNQQNKQNDSINSNGFQLFNKDGVAPGTLVVRFWNRQVVLQIHPAKEPSKQTETSIYDYDRQVNITLSAVMCKSIAGKCMREFIPALEEGRECTLGFAVGSNTAFTISTGVKRYGRVMPYIGLLRNIQQKTFKSDESMYYYFNPTFVLPGYDGEECEGIAPTMMYGECEYLIAILEAAAVALLGVESHASRVVNKRFNDQVFGLYKAIAKHINASFYGDAQSSGNKSYGGQSSVWGGNNQRSYQQREEYPATNNAEVTEVASLDDLNSFM